MKLANLIAAGAALAAGLVGGTATYLVAAQPASSEAPPTETAEVSSTSDAQAVVPSKPIVKLAPCKPPAVREGKACVTELVETVVIAASASDSTGAPATSGLEPAGDDHGDDDGDHGATGHAEDDDDHADDDHESDDDDHESDDDDHEDEDHADEDHEDEGQDD